jgi:hypothetical protein
VTYQPPSIEHREAIEQPFVLGGMVSQTFTPNWTEQPEEDPT